MTQEESIKLLIEVAKLAQANGIFNFADAIQVAKAIDVLQPQNAVADVGGGTAGSPRHDGNRPKK